MRVAGVNVDGDDQADRTVHGGPDKAVYAYAREDELWWAARLDREVPPGMFGENLTVEGVDVSGAVIGERWRIGAVELQVCQPRLPCFKLGLRFGDPQMVKLFAQAGRPGAYLRILAEGEIGAGDEVDITDRPSHGVTSRRSRRRSCSTRTAWPRPPRRPSCRSRFRAGCSNAQPEPPPR